MSKCSPQQHGRLQPSGEPLANLTSPRPASARGFAPLRVKKVKADAFAVAAQITVLIARNAGVAKETAKHIISDLWGHMNQIACEPMWMHYYRGSPST